MFVVWVIISICYDTVFTRVSETAGTRRHWYNKVRPGVKNTSRWCDQSQHQTLCMHATHVCNGHSAFIFFSILVWPTWGFIYISVHLIPHGLKKQAFSVSFLCSQFSAKPPQNKYSFDMRKMTKTTTLNPNLLRSFNDKCEKDISIENI